MQVLLLLMTMFMCFAQAEPRSMHPIIRAEIDGTMRVIRTLDELQKLYPAPEDQLRYHARYEKHLYKFSRHPGYRLAKQHIQSGEGLADSSVVELLGDEREVALYQYVFASGWVTLRKRQLLTLYIAGAILLPVILFSSGN